MPTSNRLSVFISYSGSQNSVRKIAELIAARGDIPWFDESLQGGKPWWDQILSKIRECHVFVFVLSPRSAESVPCYFELHYALQLSRPILPVFVEPIEHDQPVPESLLPIQWINIAPDDPKNSARLYEVLARIDSAPLPEKLPRLPILPNFGRRQVTFKDLKTAHKRLESIIAIYSVLAWRSARQEPPVIKQDSEWGGKVFLLECDNATWGSESRAAELFSCFVEETMEQLEGEEFLVPRLTPNEDYYYQFEWNSLFGTTLNVEISPAGEKALYALRDELAKDVIAAHEEGAPEFLIYVVSVKGLPESGSVQFLAAEGYYDWLQNGTVWPRKGWVVYVHEDRRLTIEVMERMILEAAPSPETVGDLERAVHLIQVAWLTRNTEYLEWLLKNNDALFDLLGEVES